MLFALAANKTTSESEASQPTVFTHQKPPPVEVKQRHLQAVQRSPGCGARPANKRFQNHYLSNVAANCSIHLCHL